MSMLVSTVAPVEGRLCRGVPSLPAIRPDRLKTAKMLVEKAVKLKKVFSVQGPYPVIRAALRARGWVERRLPCPSQRVPYLYGDDDRDGEDGDAGANVIAASAEGVKFYVTGAQVQWMHLNLTPTFSTDPDSLYTILYKPTFIHTKINLFTERVDGEKEENLDDMYDLMSRLVRNESSYFYWTTRRDDIDCRSLQSEQMTNHYANAGTFTTKVGLCVNLRNLHWFDTADPDTFFPRCYKLGAEDEKHAFIEDFRRTACTSLLQHVAETSRWRGHQAEGEDQNVKNSPCEKIRFVDPEIIDTSLRVCQEFLNGLQHRDIDVTSETPSAAMEQQWTDFLQNYYLVVHKGALIRGSSVYVERCHAMLGKLHKVCPQLDTDGLSNIWIIKPGAMSRGRGIMCMNRLDDILALVDTDRALAKESKWVVQKYLERPLLVHGTKFDLRQWFLVTDWNPLTVWFYNECYLRFSTQPYSTKTLDSSVHLCNNSIQKHFKTSCERHPGVPEDNMWSCTQFLSFLQHQGREAEWKSVVVPGMQQAVVHALQTAQDLVEPRKSSFELYGADFMLGRDLKPWLLEINVSPTMACSTAVTARLCPAVQVDTLRVVLDRRTDPTAYTGGFRLIHKQPAVEVPQYVGVNLLVEGAPIRQAKPLLRKQTLIPNIPLTLQISSEHSASEKIETRHKSSGKKPGRVNAFHLPDKENQDKKRLNTSASPKRERELKAEIHSISRMRRLCRSLTCEHPLVVHTEPQRKAQRLGLGLHVNGSTLVPRTLSFSLSPPHRLSNCKPQPSASQGSNISKPFLPQTTLEPQQRTSTRAFPSFQSRLPSLGVFQVRPDVNAGKAICRSSHHSTYKHRPFVHSESQNTTSSRDGKKMESSLDC